MKKKEIFKKVANYSAIVWAVCIVGVVSILAIASKFMTHDPDFSPGDPENVYLLPMLSFFFIGLASFGLMTLSGIASLLAKGEKPTFKPPLGLSIKRVFLGMGVLAFGLFAFFFAFRQANLNTYRRDQDYTGQEVFDAINQYRQKNNLKPITLDQNLCDNLVQRYLDLTNPDNTYAGHVGFERWAKNEGLAGGWELAELYIKDAYTVKNAIEFWDSSPGHRLSLQGNYASGCAYADKGTAVVVLGNSVKP